MFYPFSVRCERHSLVMGQINWLRVPVVTLWEAMQSPGQYHIFDSRQPCRKRVWEGIYDFQATNRKNRGSPLPAAAITIHSNTHLERARDHEA
jgi:hypothetical protein